MKEIIEELINNGYEAYIVGGYVRDYLLGITSNDIDICTNAPINAIMKIFKGRGKAFKEYYAYHIEENNFSYAITTYRKELEYRRNKPVKLKTAKSFEEDLIRRDFTINTFGIDSNGKLVDLLGAKRDLDSKIIRCVGNTKEKFDEDKTRILRAIRLACNLDFELDDEILLYLSDKCGSKINEIPNEFKKKELDKIFDGINPNKFFYYVKKYNLSKYFKIEFSNISKAYNKMGYWAQLRTTLPLSNEEKRLVSFINEIVSKKDISLNDVWNYNDEVIYNAACILGLSDKLKLLKEITKIHSIIDIDISINIMLKYTTEKGFKKTYKLIEKNIMDGLLNNNSEDIEKYLKEL